MRNRWNEDPLASNPYGSKSALSRWVAVNFRGFLHTIKKWQAVSLNAGNPFLSKPGINQVPSFATPFAHMRSKHEADRVYGNGEWQAKAPHLQGGDFETGIFKAKPSKNMLTRTYVQHHPRARIAGHLLAEHLWQ